MKTATLASFSGLFPTLSPLWIILLMIHFMACQDPTRGQMAKIEEANRNAKAVTTALENKLNGTEMIPDSPTASTNNAQEAAFNALMAWAATQQLGARPFNEILVEVGKKFIGQPYVGGLLDKDTSKEPLVVNFSAFDCLLLVETVTALSTQIARNDTNYQNFEATLRAIRYKDGKQGYGTRLHYFTDWILENSAHNRIKDVTKEVGQGAGLVQSKQTLNFMSTHRGSYPQLIGNDALYQEIVQMEQRLKGVQLFYVPKTNLRKIYSKLQAGDILATATNLNGLDVTHTGFVVANPDGSKGFMHASSGSGKVKISPDLQEYSMGIKAQVGIVVLRPIKP
ncbi:MAG: DUF1460 domain-containing protein [Bacteroidetes Order II. Incertae sedis bacterium]|nr:DUF1460 domain-containing protein [Bacteroidetes Order II. bacterium]